MDSKEAVLGFAKSMTWKGKNPLVTFTEKVYETALERAEGLENWFVTLNPEKCKEALAMEMEV